MIADGLRRTQRMVTIPFPFIKKQPRAVEYVARFAAAVSLKE
jgi:hypothetical protein